MSPVPPSPEAGLAGSGDDADEIRLAEFRRLCGTTGDSIGNRLALAKANIAAGDEDAGRGHLAAAAELPITNSKLAAILGGRMISVGLLTEAIAFAERWRTADPDGAADAFAIELHARHAIGDVDAALSAAERVAVAAPPSALAMYWTARILWKWGDKAAALSPIRRAIELGANHANVLGLRGRAEAAAGHDQEALSWLRAAYEAKPNVTLANTLVDCLLNLDDTGGAIAFAQSRVDEATGVEERLERQALLAHTLRYARRFEETFAFLPSLTADPHALGTHLLFADLFELTEQQVKALELLQAAATVPEQRGHVAKALWQAYLALRRFDEGHATLVDRPERTDLNRIAPHSDWRKSGGVAGRDVLFVTRAGIGDELRYLTALGDLIATAGSVKATCDPRMASLLRRTFPDVELIPLNRLATKRRWDLSKQLSHAVDDRVLAEIGKAESVIVGEEIFALLRPTLESFQNDTAVLQANPALRDKWRRQLQGLGDRPKVAITWRSGHVDYRRSEFYTRADEWAPFFQLGKDAAFINFQYDIAESERSILREGFGDGFIELDGIDLKDGLEDVFAVLAEVDLVISPNTALHQFAGAVAAPTLFLTPRPFSYFTWRLRDPATGEDCLYRCMKHIRPTARSTTPP